MPRPRPAASRAVLGAALVALLSGCVSQDLAFRVDDRVTFTTPEERATVRLPLTLEWDVRDFRVTGPGAGEPSRDAGYFAVFLDRAPMPPGEGLRWLARKDRSCRADDGCPDEEYLSARGVHTTTGTRLVLEQVPRLGEEEEARERHRAVVVLLDADGRRIGESAYELVFDLDRSGAP